MNPVDVTPETVAREYEQIAQKWNIAAAGEANSPEEAPEKPPISEPKDTVSAQTYEQMMTVDISPATLEKWGHKYDADYLRRSIVANQKATANMSRVSMRRFLGFKMCDDAIDEFAEALSPVVVHYYPEGGIFEAISRYGMWFTLIGSAVGLGRAVYHEYTGKTAQVPTEQHSEENQHVAQ